MSYDYVNCRIAAMHAVIEKNCLDISAEYTNCGWSVVAMGPLDLPVLDQSVDVTIRGSGATLYQAYVSTYEALCDAARLYAEPSVADLETRFPMSDSG